MQVSPEQTRWLLKVLEPERTGLAPEVYTADLAKMRADAKQAAQELLEDPVVAALVDQLPSAKVVAFGDSHTSDPESWAVILKEMLATRRPTISFTISAVAGETTTHGLVRIGQVLAMEPTWLLFFSGVNDARTQGPSPTKTLVHAEETARNFIELRERASKEAKARCLWVTPAPVIEERVAHHPGLGRFGVRFRNEDVARVGEAIRKLDGPTVDLFARFGAVDDFLLADGLHFNLAGQKRIALEILQGWSATV